MAKINHSLSLPRRRRRSGLRAIANQAFRTESCEQQGSSDIEVTVEKSR